MENSKRDEVLCLQIEQEMTEEFKAAVGECVDFFSRCFLDCVEVAGKYKVDEFNLLKICISSFAEAVTELSNGDIEEGE